MACQRTAVGRAPPNLVARSHLPCRSNGTWHLGSAVSWRLPRPSVGAVQPEAAEPAGCACVPSPCSMSGPCLAVPQEREAYVYGMMGIPLNSHTRALCEHAGRFNMLRPLLHHMATRQRGLGVVRAPGRGRVAWQHSWRPGCNAAGLVWRQGSSAAPHACPGCLTIPPTRCCHGCCTGGGQPALRAAVSCGGRWGGRGARVERHPPTHALLLLPGLLGLPCKQAAHPRCLSLRSPLAS